MTTAVATRSELQEVEPIPGPPPPQPIPFAYSGPADPFPVEASPEALAMLAKHHGRLALDEMAGAVRTLDGVVKERIQAMQRGGAPKDHLPVILDAGRRRAVYAGHHAALVRILKVKAALPDAPTVPPLVLVLGHAEGAGDVRAQVAKAIASVKKDLATCNADINALTQTMGDPDGWAGLARPMGNRVRDMAQRALVAVAGVADLQQQCPGLDLWVRSARDLAGNMKDLPTMPWPGRHPADFALDRLTTLLRQRAELQARLTALEADTAQAQAVVASRVQSAVEAAGGIDAVVDGLADALVVSGRWLEAHADFPTLARIQAERAGVAKTLGQLRDGGPMAKNLQSQAQTLDTQTSELRGRIDSQRRAEVTALVESACRGDEDARKAVEDMAAGNPLAFVPRFPAAIAAAEFSRAVLTELAVVLTAD